MNSVLRRPGYQRQGVPDVPVGWPWAGVPVLSPSPVRLKQVLSQLGDQVIDSAPLVCDDERLSRKWRRRPCLIRSSKTRSSTRPFANPTGIGGSPTRESPTRLSRPAGPVPTSCRSRRPRRRASNSSLTRSGPRTASSPTTTSTASGNGSSYGGRGNTEASLRLLASSCSTGATPTARTSSSSARSKPWRRSYS